MTDPHFEACPLCGQRVLVRADGRLNTHFKGYLRQPTNRCKASRLVPKAVRALVLTDRAREHVRIRYGVVLP